MSVQEKILNYLSVYGKDNEYRMSRALKIDVNEVTEALDVMEKEGKIEIINNTNVKEILVKINEKFANIDKKILQGKMTIKEGYDKKIIEIENYIKIKCLNQNSYF